MSWQTYVDSNLVGTGFVTQGAIAGHDGSIWAISPGWKISADEVKKIIAAYTDPGPLRASGMFLNSDKYFVLQVTDRSIYGKKGAGGVVVVKTGQTVLIALYNDKIQPGQCTNVVEKLGDYLIENGY